MNTSTHTNATLPTHVTDEAQAQSLAQTQARKRTVWQSRLRRLLVGACIVTGVVLTPLTTHWPQTTPLLRDLVLIGGTLMIGAGVALRLWAGLYIGGHKERRLVTEGPYSLVRNPLYLGNLLAALGIVSLTGSPLVASVVIGMIAGVYLTTIAQEERKLGPLFGADYAAYLREVPALIPRPAAIRALIHDTAPVRITHRSLARELTRCAGIVALGLVAFLLTTAALSLQGLFATLT